MGQFPFNSETKTGREYNIWYERKGFWDETDNKKKTLKTHHKHVFFEGDAGVLMPHRSDSRVVHFTESYLWPSLFSECAGYSPTKNARLLPHTKLCKEKQRKWHPSAKWQKPKRTILEDTVKTKTIIIIIIIINDLISSLVKICTCS